MATTYFVDFLNGNDTNNGTTFALRKKTLGFTSGLVAGDSVRVMQSPNYTTLSDAGSSSITSGGSTMTLANALNDTIDTCESGWVGTTNVTVTHTTTAKQGTNSVSIAASATFTTGLAAYKTLATTLNPSNTSGISFWIRQVSGTIGAASTITIKLCSDTLGATPVSTYNIPALSATVGFWHPLKIAGATGTGINSVAFYINTDNGAQTFLIDNLITCGSSDLSLVSLLSPTTSNWMTIKSIVGTTVTFDTSTNSTPAEVGYFDGFTGSSVPYKIETIKLAIASQSGNSLGSIASTGTSAARIGISGGWDTTDMTTAAGQTLIDGTAGTGYGLALGCKFTDVSNISCFRFNYGAGPIGTGFLDSSLTAPYLNANSAYGLFVQSTNVVSQRAQFNIGNLNYNSSASASNGGAIGYTGGPSDTSSGNYIQISNIVGNNLFILTGPAPTILTTSDAINNEFFLIEYCNYNQRGLLFAGFINSIFQLLEVNGQKTLTYPFLTFGGSASTTAMANTTGAVPKNNLIQLGAITLPVLGIAINIGTAYDNEIDFSAATIIGSPTNFITATGAGKTYIIGADLNALGYSVTLKSHELVMINSTINTATKLTLPPYGTFNTSRIAFQNYSSTAGDCRIYSPVGTVLTDTTTTVSGRSWKITPTSTANLVTSAIPLTMPIGEAYVTAGSLVTMTIQVLRAASTQYVVFSVEGGNAKDPIDSAPSITLSGGTTGSWETMTLTFTPDRAGVAKINIGVYNAPSTSVYVDALTVNQA